MFALVVQALVQRLAQDAPLQSEISAAPQVVGAVNGPTERAMVKDDLVYILGVECVVAALGTFRLVLISETAPQVSNDHVCAVSDLESTVLERDAISGCRLASDRDCGFLQHQLALQFDDAGDIENNRARTHCRAKPLTKRTCAGVLQIGHMVDITAAATRGKASKAFRTGKGRRLSGPSFRCQKVNAQQTHRNAPIEEAGAHRLPIKGTSVTRWPFHGSRNDTPSVAWQTIHA